MRRTWWVRGSMFALFAVAAVAALGAVVMVLWNWLMPELFGWHAIGFAQAVGLLVLSKILLGGLRGRHGRGMYWRQRMMERWAHMSEEERLAFREGMRRRCGGAGRRADADAAR